METVTKKELAEALAEMQNISEVKAKQEIEAVTSLIGDFLAEGYNVKISKFFNFILRDTNEREGFNPRNQEKITIPASRKVVVKPSRELKARIKWSRRG